ncbi:hypothetical protein C4573_05880 [Candidatus Woesearchaeota archaeon]|nr:MAG: hypothetical protein C4573_05880 [Candidatus Woesearchaeota archaeon]
MDLVERIRPEYDSLSLHVPIRAKKRMLGEIDVLARKGSKIDIYEVKCSHRIVKAKRQKRKMHKYLQTKFNFFFYCGSSGSLIML